MYKATFFLFSIGCAVAADTSFVFEKDVTTQVDLADKPVPKWRDGTMVLLDPHRGPQAGIFIQNGEQSSRLNFAIPGATQVIVRD